jgi:hypothetical protein
MEAKPPADLEAIGFGHCDVEKDDVRRVGLGELETRLAVLSRVDLEALISQPSFQERGQLRVVVDEEKSRRQKASSNEPFSHRATVT